MNPANDVKSQREEETIKAWQQVPIVEIHVKDNPSRAGAPTQEEIDAAKATIAEVSLLQPIVVEHRKLGGYQLLAGETRLCAAKALGWKTIPAKVLEEGPKARAVLVNIAENTARRKANEYKLATQIHDRFKAGISIPQIAAAIGESRLWVEHRVEIVEHVAPSILDELKRNESAAMLKDLLRVAKVGRSEKSRAARDAVQREWWKNRHEVDRVPRPKSTKKSLRMRVKDFAGLARTAQEGYIEGGWFGLTRRERALIVAIAESLQRTRVGPPPLR